MAEVRAMTVIEAGSGLPEDRIVNTMHFYLQGVTYVDHIALAGAAIESFWNSPGSTELPQQYPIASYLSPWLNVQAEIRFYDLEQIPVPPMKRVPTVQELLLASPVSTSGLPEEVACVSTIYGAAPVTRRRRGRMYIGPLGNVAMFPSSGASAPTRPHSLFITALSNATTRLANSPAGFAIMSSVPSKNFVPVVGGYVDNAFDTQRRRGPDPSARAVWVKTA